MNKTFKEYLPTITFGLGVVITLAGIYLTQGIITKRETGFKRNEIISRLSSHIQLIRFYWMQYYCLEATEAILMKEPIKNNISKNDLEQIRSYSFKFLENAIEARSTLLEILEDVELYFPRKNDIDSIINLHNWQPKYYLQGVDIRNNQVFVLEDTNQCFKELTDSITIYFKPLYDLVHICKEYAGIKVK